MFRPPPLGTLAVAIWLLATACTGDNPLYTGGSTDAADGPASSDGPDRPEAADAPADAPAAEAAVDILPADASSEASPSDTPAPGALGSACTAPGGCASGFCVDGVCCDTACRERCRSCAVAGSPGTCTLIPAGADPRAECPAQDPSTCGRAGGCDGQGDCQLHAAGTECRARSCSAGVEVSAASCNGSGACNPGTPAACTLAECAGDRCTVGCSTTSCPTGFTCQGGKCMGGGPVLHWKFDETSGTTAADSSGNGFTGSYRGEGALPVPSTSVPPRLSGGNPRSLAFGASGRPGVQLTPFTPLLQPARTLTVSVWYRATTAPAVGSDVMNLGGDYLIRLKPDAIEFAKRRSDTLGMIYQLATARDLGGHLDGNWHHLAGVITATTVNIYYDGRLRNSKPNSDPILYRGTELWAGRNANAGNELQGGLDDLRIYNRDLSELEIQQLAGTAP
jgi:hypothetical protein